MKIIITFAFICHFCFFQAQSIKSKNLKLKYSPPEGWTAEEFGGKSPWEGPGNSLCHCSGVHFSKSHQDGKMHVLIYPSTQTGLDSTKRNLIGNLEFVDVVKYDRVRNNNMSFERKKSNFIIQKTKTKSFEAFRYFTKVDDHYLIIFAWQENTQALNSTNEKELFSMVNAIEPN